MANDWKVQVTSSRVEETRGQQNKKALPTDDDRPIRTVYNNFL